MNYKMESGEYEVLYPITSMDNVLPKGLIVIWYGNQNNIPSGWALCDGNNDTPDLRGRFILGYSSSHEVGSVGGEENHQLTIQEMPSHNHTFRYGSPSQGSAAFTSYAQSSSPRSYNVTSTGGNQAHNNMPPYYTLCYIMKL